MELRHTLSVVCFGAQSLNCTQVRVVVRNSSKAFSLDVWVTCKSNKWSSFAIRCYPDGAFTIDGKSGDDITLPDCEPVGCDPSEIPFTGMTRHCKHVWDVSLFLKLGAH